MTKKVNTYYKVMFDDGDIDMELYPQEDEDGFEDYDSSNLEEVKRYAKVFKGSRIVKVTEENIA